MNNEKSYKRQVIEFWLKAFSVLVLMGSCMYLGIKGGDAKVQRVLNSPPNYTMTDNTIIYGSKEIAFKYITHIKHTREGLLEVSYDFNQGASFGYLPDDLLIKKEPFLSKYRSRR